MIKTTLIFVTLAWGAMLNAGIYTSKVQGIFEYQFKLADVHLPGDAKMANTYFLRDYFHAVVSFDDETDLLYINTDMDILQADLQAKATNAGYTITFFEKSTVE